MENKDISGTETVSTLESAIKEYIRWGFMANKTVSF